MKKILILILGLFGVAQSQTIGYLRYDTVKVQKVGGNGELRIENATRGVVGGVFTNVTGNGWGQWVAPGSLVPAWLLTGNSGTVAGTNYLGTNDAINLQLRTNGLKRFTINTSGAFGLGTGEDYGTAGWLFQTNGSGAAPTWVNTSSLPYWKLASGGSLTGNNTIFGTGNSLFFNALAGLTATSTANIQLTAFDGVSTLNGSTFGMTKDSVWIYPQYGNLSIDTLNNVAAQNTLMGWVSTAGASRGYVGNVTLGTNLSLTSGVLNAAGSGISGSGTLNYVPKWTPNGTTLGNSGITDDGTTIGIAGSAAILSLGGGGATAKLRFLEPSGNGTNYSEFSSVAQAANLSYTLPPAFVSGGVLTDAAGNGTLTWAAPTVTPSNTVTLTNKRWTARVGSTTSSATPTINTDDVDIYKLTAQAGDITSMTTNLSGTPVDGDILEIQITGTAARAITWGASFVSSTVTLPTTTVTTATLTTVFQYYTTSSYGNNKWVCVNYF